MPKNFHPGSPVQALVIGRGDVALQLVEQLVKNPRFHITWAGEKLEKDKFMMMEDDSVIRVIKLKKAATPLTMNRLIENHKPDIVFLCQRNREAAPAGDTVASSNLEREMLGESARVGNAPVITVSLEQ